MEAITNFSPWLLQHNCLGVHHYIHSGDVVSLSPDPAVKPAGGRAAGLSSSGWNSAEAHAGPAWASDLRRAVDLSTRL